jgi:hypothetical protein
MHALSPAAAAIANAIVLETNSTYEMNNPRAMALSLASGFNEVVRLLPIDY